MIELVVFQQLVGSLRAQSSRVKKEAVLKREVENRFSKLAELLTFALDPMITYGISDIPDESHEVEGSYPSDYEGLKKLLRDLQHRNITGHEAAGYVRKMFDSLDTESKKAFRMIIQRKLQCGLGAKSINKVFPKLINQFDLMLASPWKDGVATLKKELKAGHSLWVEPKYDGERRVIVIGGDGHAAAYTRTGHVDDRFRGLLDLVESLVEDGEIPNSCVLDGELWPHDNDFARLSSMTSSKGTFSLEESNCCFCIFDMLMLDEWVEQSCPLSYVERRHRMLENLTGRNNGWLYLVPSIKADSIEKIEELFGHFLNYGLEGIICKTGEGLYTHKRDRCWVKMKTEETVDLEINEILRGDQGGRFENSLGRLLCYYQGHPIKVAPGKMPHEERDLIWQNTEEYIGKTIEVAFQSVTPDGSLRHPRFLRWRADKD